LIRLVRPVAATRCRREGGRLPRRAGHPAVGEAAPVRRAEGVHGVVAEQTPANLRYRVPEAIPLQLGSATADWSRLTRRATSAPDRVALLVEAAGGATAPSGGCHVEARLLSGQVSSRPIAPRRDGRDRGAVGRDAAMIERRAQAVSKIGVQADTTSAPARSCPRCAPGVHAPRPHRATRKLATTGARHAAARRPGGVVPLAGRRGRANATLISTLQGLLKR
jgi:hypothetical protein